MMAKNKPLISDKIDVLGEVLPIKSPFSISIEVSNLCNIRCNYCFRSHEDSCDIGYIKNKKVMTMDCFKKIVAQIKQFERQPKRISFQANGEPTCNPLLPDMIKYARKEGLESEFAIATNGLLLSNDLSCALIDAGLDRILISLQGITSRAYEKICGQKVDFNKFLDEIKFLYESRKKIKLYIKIADISLEDGEDEAFYNMFGNICDNIYVERIVPAIKSIDYDGIIKTGNKQIQTRYNNGYGIQQCCSRAFYNMVVNEAGEIYPCCYFLKPIELETIHTTTMREAWESPVRKQFLKDILQLKINKYAACKTCSAPTVSICTKEDIIDSYRKEILYRIENEIYGG